MRIKIALAGSLIACVLTMWSCSGGSVPSSPSIVNPVTAPGNGTLRPLDDPPPMPDPTAPAPLPDPTAPAPDPTAPAPAPAPTPMAVIIGIIGSFGSNAFMPNPTTANVGDQIVFSNTDVRLHHIVMDDGTDLGDVQPGQSSAPMTLATPTATFHCTIHPTMIGGINVDAAPAPYEPPPRDDYGYYRSKSRP